MCEPGVVGVTKLESLDVGVIVGNSISSLDHLFIVGFENLCE
jgi:hypothetical protein